MGVVERKLRRPERSRLLWVTRDDTSPHPYLVESARRAGEAVRELHWAVPLDGERSFGRFVEVGGRNGRAYTARQVGLEAPLAEASDRVNERTKQELVEQVSEIARPGDKVAVLGVTYRPNTYITEEAAGLYLAQQSNGAAIAFSSMTSLRPPPILRAFTSSSGFPTGRNSKPIPVWG